jgi:hypothetical protein
MVCALAAVHHSAATAVTIANVDRGIGLLGSRRQLTDEPRAEAVSSFAVRQYVRRRLTPTMFPVDTTFT